VLVLLTHDHADHAGVNQDTCSEMLKALSSAGINVKTSGQSDLPRSPTGLLPKFQAAGLLLARSRPAAVTTMQPGEMKAITM
jgi:hypothetical protein